MRIRCFQSVYLFFGAHLFDSRFFILKVNFSKSLQKVINFTNLSDKCMSFGFVWVFFRLDLIWLKSGFLKQTIALNFEQKYYWDRINLTILGLEP